MNILDMFSVDVSAMRHINGRPLHGISLFKLCEETLPKCSQDFPGLSETTSTEMQCKPQSPAMCSALRVRIMTTNVMSHDAYWNFTTWQLKGWKLCQAARPSEDPAAQSWPHYVATQSNASCIFMHCLPTYTNNIILYSWKTNSRAALLCRSRGNPLGGRTFLVHPWCQALLPSCHARCPRRTPSAECTFLAK